MPVYGAPLLYGAPTLYGYDVAIGTQLYTWRRVYGGAPPWLPTNIAYWRQRCAHIIALDDAHVELGELTEVSAGSARQTSARDVLPPTDTLSLELADPTGRYLDGGDREAWVLPDAQLRLDWTVTTPAGTLSRQEMRYRVTAGPELTRDRWGREVLRVQAQAYLEGALDSILGTYYNAGPPSVPGQLTSSPTRWAIAVAEATNWGDVVEELWDQVGAAVGWRATPAGLRTAVPTGDDLVNFNDPFAAGTWPTYRAMLAGLHSTYGLTATYQGPSALLLQAAPLWYDAGYVVSADADRGGGFPVPWERAVLARARPAFTRVEVWYSWLQEDGTALTPEGEEPTTIEPTPVQVLAGSAQSVHPLYPHGSRVGRTEALLFSEPLEGDAVGIATRGETADALAARRLGGYLGNADQLTLQVDSACPLPPLGDAVLVVLPDDHLSSYYRVMGATVPLGVGPASWTLQWVANA